MSVTRSLSGPKRKLWFSNSPFHCDKEVEWELRGLVCLELAVLCPYLCNIADTVTVHFPGECGSVFDLNALIVIVFNVFLVEIEIGRNLKVIQSMLCPLWPDVEARPGVHVLPSARPLQGSLGTAPGAAGRGAGRKGRKRGRRGRVRTRIQTLRADFFFFSHLSLLGKRTRFIACPHLRLFLRWGEVNLRPVSSRRRGCGCISKLKSLMITDGC